MSFYEWFVLEEGRTPEGMFSFAHLASVTITLCIFLFLAIWLGKKFKDNPKGQFYTMLACSISLFVNFVIKIGVTYYTYGGTFWGTLIGNAPMYLCDMMIFVVPLATFTKGRFRDCCYDFIAIWGPLMGFFGNYFAGNIYYSHSAISFYAVSSLIQHCLTGFAGFFVFAAGLNKMEKRNILFSTLILVVYMTTALILDYVDEHNFMFFFDGNGTPFTLFQNLVHDIKPLYQLEIYILQCGYMVGFYFLYYLIHNYISKQKTKKQEQNQA